jgi:hypothetical protein
VKGDKLKIRNFSYFEILKSVFPKFVLDDMGRFLNFPLFGKTGMHRKIPSMFVNKKILPKKLQLFVKKLVF